MTEYLVLVEEAGHWREAGTANLANSAAQAIRRVAGEEGGRYVAVPRRSWQPVTVRVEQQTRITIEGEEAQP